ncbi:lysozyme family protein [Bacillus mycoides]|uniref:lysozyme family protein n=1 Tax=Bacillus mycoides TaxID=1405 RepID=UPI0010BE6D0D|nr:lysozyme family protein [Bacillus mycoides]TKI39096.1 lytic transglycosylase [Bacillus mycoides]
MDHNEYENEYVEQDEHIEEGRIAKESKQKVRQKALAAGKKAAKALGGAAKKGIKAAGKAVATKIGGVIGVGCLPIIGIVIVLMLVIGGVVVLFSPGGDEETVKKYADTAVELKLDWHELVAFSMALYDNNLEGKDPQEAAIYFFTYKHEEKKTEEICVEKDGNPCAEKQTVEKTVTTEELQGPKIKDKLGGSSLIEFYKTHAAAMTNHGLEKAMDLAGFSEDKKNYVRSIISSGMLDELYPTLSSIGSSSFGGYCGGPITTNGTAKNINPKIAKHEPILAQEAQKQGIPEFTQLLMALMNREGGDEPENDPMQVSEAICNGQRNCTTSPQMSIQRGVEVFKSRLQLADGDIAMGLQAYNMGDGYVKMAKSMGGHSEESAKAYAEKYRQSTSCGWRTPWCYGDYKYVEHVLEYYDDKGCQDNNLIAGDGWMWPTKSTRITDYFDTNRGGKLHGAVDVGAIQAGVAGDPIFAMADGMVTKAGTVTRGGLGIYIDHGQSIKSRYLHMSELSVQTGQMVKKGQVIGKMGGSDFKDGVLIPNGYAVHLDFVVYINDQATDPLKFFKDGQAIAGTPAAGSGKPNTSDKRKAIVDEASKYLGQGKVRYVSGAREPQNGKADCSGFTDYIYKKIAGINIGSWTGEQIKSGKTINISQAQVGDLIFFENPGHVAIVYDPAKRQMIHIGDDKGVQITDYDYAARGQRMVAVKNVLD